MTKHDKTQAILTGAVGLLLGICGYLVNAWFTDVAALANDVAEHRRISAAAFAEFHGADANAQLQISAIEKKLDSIDKKLDILITKVR
jgi:hypothetical protein